MKWTKDVGAETVLNRLSIKFQMERIDANAIDVKLSRANTARAFRIDADHAESISLAIMRGDPIPAIVVRKILLTTKEKYKCVHVIAGGNHRDEGCRIAGESEREAYVVECTDTEFTILCRLLNTVVGQGATKADRVMQACDAVRASAMTATSAAIEFNVSKQAISKALKLQAANLRLQSKLDSAKTKISPNVALALADVQLDSVLDKAIELVAKSKLSGTDIVTHVREAIKLPSEAEQANYLAGVIERNQNVGRSPITSKKRAAFLKSISALENLIVSSTTYSALEIINDVKEIKARCQKLAQRLNTLS
jgi:hypothetical protein